MQELLFPYITQTVEDDFDGFHCIAYHVYPDWDEERLRWKAAALLQKQNPNGKKIYIVADRDVLKTTSSEVRTHNVLEFKHSLHRAQQEYQERVNG